MFSLEKLRSQIIQVLHLQEPPHRTALAFAIGVFIAFSPTYGLHAISAVFCSWAFRLNFLAVFVGSLINNPWTLAPILGITIWTGFLLLDTPAPQSLTWDSITTENLFEVVSPYILPFTLGHLVWAFAGSLLTYPIALFIISKVRKERKKYTNKIGSLFISFW